MIDVHQNSNFIQKIWRTTSRVLSEIAVKNSNDQATDFDGLYYE